MNTTTTPTEKKKAPTWFVLVFCLGLVLLFYKACFSGSDEPEQSAIEKLDPMLRPEILPGFLPHEVIALLKEEGMSDQPSHSRNSTMHMLRGAYDGIQVETVITTWRAGGESFATGFTSTAIAGVNPDIQAGLPFFQYMAGVTYDGSNPSAAHEWVTANYNADSASVSIGEGRWLLRSTTPGSRVLMLRHHMPYDDPQ